MAWATSRRAVALAMLLGASAGVGACNALLGDTGSLSLDAGGTLQSDGADASNREEGGGGPEGSALDGGSHAFDADASWSAFNLEPEVFAPVAGEPPPCFAGGTFDGRYVYFAPSLPLIPGRACRSTTTAVRYDTQHSDGGDGFNDTSAWETFDTDNTNPSQGRGFFGAVFDGRYVNFVPNNDQSGGINVVARFDTRSGSFGSSSGWTSTEVPAPDGGHIGCFVGGMFDGHNVDLVPLYSELLASYSASSGFDGWLAPVSIPSTSPYFHGGVFDGQFIYLAPYNGNWAVRCGVDVGGTIPGSCTSFDIAPIGHPAFSGLSFMGAVFDGRYVYFVPDVEPAPQVVVRYDTDSAPGFDGGESWMYFDVTSLETSGGDTGFAGGAFDGRYVYLVPFYGANVVRYDTNTDDFNAAASWEQYSLVSLSGATGSSFFPGFVGAVFDGEYLYFIPNGASIVVRFDARSRSPLPSLWDGGAPLWDGGGTWAGSFL